MKHTLAFHLIHLSRKLQKALDYKCPPVSLSYSQAFAILIISTHNQVSQKDISTKLHLEPASVVTLIDELEKLTLVERKNTEGDRRKYQIILTPKGREKVDIIRKRGQSLDKFLESQLTSKENTDLHNIIEKLSNGLDNREGGEKSEISGAKRSMAI